MSFEDIKAFRICRRLVAEIPSTENQFQSSAFLDVAIECTEVAVSLGSFV